MKKGNKVMTNQEFINLYNQMKKGTLHTIVYVKTEKGYTKTTTMLVRFVNYFNTKAYKASGKQPNANPTPNPNIITIIPHVLTTNTKTGNTLVHCYPIKNHKAKSVYQDQNGNTIDKATYEQVVKPKAHGDTPVFQINILNLVSIK